MNFFKFEFLYAKSSETGKIDSQNFEAFCKEVEFPCEKLKRIHINFNKFSLELIYRNI